MIFPEECLSCLQRGNTSLLGSSLAVMPSSWIIRSLRSISLAAPTVLRRESVALEWYGPCGILGSRLWCASMGLVPTFFVSEVVFSTSDSGTGESRVSGRDGCADSVASSLVGVVSDTKISGGVTVDGAALACI